MNPKGTMVSFLLLLWVLAGPNGLPLFPPDAYPPFQTEEDCADTADWLNEQAGQLFYRCVEEEDA